MTMSWAEDYQPVVYNLFMMGVDMVPSLIPALYNVQTSNSAFEYFLGLEGTDVEGWNAYKTSGTTAYADFDRGFPKTFQHYNYTRNFKLLQDYIEDGTLNSAAQMAIRGLGISAAQKRETDETGRAERAHSGTSGAPASGAALSGVGSAGMPVATIISGPSGTARPPAKSRYR